MNLPSPATTRRLIAIAFLVAWELFPRLGLIPPLFLPPLSATAMALFSSAGEYGQHLLVTLGEVGTALVFACGGGIACGVALGASPSARRTLLPMVSSAYAVPLVILYPLFSAWFGIGPQSKVVFASIYGFLPTVLGAAAGVQTVDRSLLMTARSMGATPVQQIVRVFIPAAMPIVLSSIRIGGALVIVGVVVAEMLMSTAGIGFLISRHRTLLDSPRVFAAILLVLALAILFDLLIQLAERRLVGWKGKSTTRSSSGSEG